jgi:hypothetical protein
MGAKVVRRVIRFVSAHDESDFVTLIEDVDLLDQIYRGSKVTTIEVQKFKPLRLPGTLEITLHSFSISGIPKAISKNLNMVYRL